jgi:hypothetical protein
LERILQNLNELIVPTLQKRTLKKLILDCCNKTAFVQKDGVSMGSSLGPVLAIVS